MFATQLGLEPSEAQVVHQMPPLLSRYFLSVTPVIATVSVHLS